MTLINKRKQQGSITVAAAVVLPVLVIFIGLALTYSYAMVQQTQLGNASESAAIYLAKRDAKDEQRNLPAALAIVQQFNGLNKAQQSSIGLVHSNDTYRVNAQLNSEKFGSHKQSDNLKVSNKGTASTKSKPGGQFDIAMVLDLSSSLNSSIPQIKRTLNQVVDEIQTNFGDGNVRLSIVPFTNFVSIEDADWLPASANGIECVTGMSYIPGFFGTQLREDVATTASEVLNIPSELRRINHWSRPLDTTFLDEGCPDIGTVSLTEDMEKIKTRVNRFQGSNSLFTVYHHAVIYGARMLTERWTHLWDRNAELRPDSNKAMIIIGDGQDGGVYHYDFRNMINYGMCENIKNDGIKIYGLRTGDYTVGSNMELCIGTFDNMADLTDFSALIDKILTDAGVGNAEQKIKLVP